MTASPSRSTFASSAPHQAAFIVYINGLEVPAKSVSMRFGVWVTPEMQVEMVADPVLIRLGNEDRVQVAVFYLDDCAVDPSVQPEFRLFGEGEITGWGYRNTSGGRSIVFTVVNQIAIFTQLFVQFMTTLDDMVGHSAAIDSTTKISVPSSELVFPFALFQQGLLPTQGQKNSLITRPFDFLYNAVRWMMDSVVPADQRTVPAANFFTRWARLTNFHNRFAGCPSFDATSNASVFPVLQALQSTSAIDAVIKNLIPNVQNTGSIWDMLQLVFQTMLMEIAMIPGMPLVSVSLATGMVLQTDFSSHQLVLSDVFTSGPGIPPPVNTPAYTALGAGARGQWVPTVSDAARATQPLRMQNYFPKPQMLFSIPPSCNVIFPSQLKTIAYEENYATQPTRLYLNDEVLTQIVKAPQSGLTQSIENALTIAYPPLADQILQSALKQPIYHAKNFLLYPEEFFKGPVMDRRTAPPWLFFLKQNEVTQVTAPADNAAPPNPATPAQTGNQAPPRPGSVAPGVMVTQSNAGVAGAGPGGRRQYDPATEALRPKIQALIGTGYNAIPLDFALCWVNMESGGSIKSTDPSDGSIGYFQLNNAERPSLRSAAFPEGVTSAQVLALNSNLSDFNPATNTAITSGLAFIAQLRPRANALAKQFGLNWSEGDMWRLTKAFHAGIGFWGGTTSGYPGFFAIAKQALGGPAPDWSSLFNAVLPTLTPGGQLHRALMNATACGGVIATASGTMITKEDPRPFTAPSATPSPPAPSVATSAPPAPPAPADAAPVVDATTQAAVATFTEDVYHLYAKYEYFRERYARRSGSATVAWNPYVVPGFPGAIFDQRASRVDLMVYITGVQLSMSHAGQRSTTLSFLYGRQFQEMFEQLATEFAQNDATARGSGPQEPIRAISNIVQSFPQAETFYQQLFYGGQSLFGKAASFDFRAVVGLESTVPGGSPEPIFVDGPDSATQDGNIAAAQTISTLLTKQVAATSLVASLQSQLEAAQGTADTYASQGSTVARAAYLAATQDAADLRTQILGAQAQLTSINVQIAAATTTLQAQTGTPGVPRVLHNLDDAAARPLVPLPATQTLFDSYDAATAYNWRPICTLDEYVIFYDVAGVGAIPAYGHPRSVGARYFDRIRTLTPPPAPVNGVPFAPPPGSDGTTTTAVPGLNQAFPQVAADWDAQLLAYKNNVLNVKAPRT